MLFLQQVQIIFYLLFIELRRKAVKMKRYMCQVATVILKCAKALSGNTYLRSRRLYSSANPFTLAQACATSVGSVLLRRFEVCMILKFLISRKLQRLNLT